ncbi:MAG TPA: PHP domain-containing protein [Terriglobia bacterium]|nr:PHP domain-containing protein [Terriglobia bacterium]
MGQPLSNAEIADKLFGLAHLLAAQRENTFKVKAYRRAAKTVQTLGDSIVGLVRDGADLTQFVGIGPAIAGVIREIVETGTTRQYQALESQISPEFVEILRYPRLDPKRVLRIYRKLNIGTIEELQQRLVSGEIARTLGPRLDQHVRRGLTDHAEILLHEADRTVPVIKDFLIARCGVGTVEAAGDYRRRVEVIGEIHFLIETADLPEVMSKLKTYGGKADFVTANHRSALFRLSSGLLLRITAAPSEKWGVALLEATGSETHLEQLNLHGSGLAALFKSPTVYPTEAAAYAELGLPFIPPELREGKGEIELAAAGKLPALLQEEHIRGELHAHTTSSDGVDTVEVMAEAARDRGLDYIGISDHSQSLKIARGLSISRLLNQLRFIDRLNERLTGIRILKAAEVDILEDGSLDYPDDVLKELDYTICSIHSRFGLNREAQTTRIRRAMDNRYFKILGHATGRLLLKRPGYEIDIDRVVEHARTSGCFFELNSSPDRLDLSADHARIAREAGVKMAVTTDAHSTGELSFLRYGVDQARRAGLERTFVLNALSWPDLSRALRR